MPDVMSLVLQLQNNVHGDMIMVIYLQNVVPDGMNVVLQLQNNVMCLVT